MQIKNILLSGLGIDQPTTMSNTAMIYLMLFLKLVSKSRSLQFGPLGTSIYQTSTCQPTLHKVISINNSETFLQVEPNLRLTQELDFHTRGTNILDFLFTNRPDLVNQCFPLVQHSDHHSDHHAVLVDTNISAQRI